MCSRKRVGGCTWVGCKGALGADISPRSYFESLSTSDPILGMDSRSESGMTE